MISAHTSPDAATVQPDHIATPALTEYQAKLHPWCIVRLLPKMQRIVVRRFRKGNDAEAHMRSLKHLMPSTQFIVIFDPADRTPVRNVKHSAKHSGQKI